MSGRPKTVNRVNEDQSEQRRNRGQHPGHAPVAGQLFVDRFDPQPQPPEPAPPLVFARSPACLDIFLLHGSVPFHHRPAASGRIAGSIP